MSDLIYHLKSIPHHSSKSEFIGYHLIYQECQVSFNEINFNFETMTFSFCTSEAFINIIIIYSLFEYYDLICWN